MSKRFAEKVCLVTGATSGIGRATAVQFAREGARLALTGRNVERGQRVLQEVLAAGAKDAEFWPGDVTDSVSVGSIVKAVADRFGRIDVLFNNAGINGYGAVDEISVDAFRRVIEVNLLGQFYFAREVVPIMKRKGAGAIVNTASDWGIVAGPKTVAYSASKGGVIMMTKAIALDHAADGIRCNAICPGDTLTPMTVDRLAFEGQDSQEDVDGAALPLGRCGRPEEIATAVAFLASDDSSFVTGVALPADGGNTCR